MKFCADEFVESVYESSSLCGFWLIDLKHSKFGKVIYSHLSFSFNESSRRHKCVLSLR